jgi:hypothetical protein
MYTLHLRAEIVVELEAADFVEAAAHQNRLETLMAQLRDVYPHAKLQIRERRDRGPRPSSPPRPRGHATGRLHHYEET